jgi:hypothetical protein
LRHLITTFRPPHVSNWFPRRDYLSFLASNGKHATRFTLGPYRDRCRSRGLWLGSRSLGRTPSDVGIASQKRRDSPRVLHFKNQQSSLDNHQSTPCPPRGSGCLKVVKNAGTVPGFLSPVSCHFHWKSRSFPLRTWNDVELFSIDWVTWGLPPGGVWGMLAKERADARESCSDYWVD